MIDGPAPGDERHPKILVSDASPLSLLGTVPGALDWLFVPNCEVWLADIVMDEVLRDPGEERDRRIDHRAEIAEWISHNRHRIKRLRTLIGDRYAEEMRQYEQARTVWEMAGRPAGLEPRKPDWQDRGDEGVWVAVRMANAAVGLGECVIALADDGEVRDAIVLRGRRQRQASINLMGTQTFIRWMAEDFGIEAAETAWQAIARAREDKVPHVRRDSSQTSEDSDDPEDLEPGDPVYIRVP
jgi:hypothetical protein